MPSYMALIMVLLLLVLTELRSYSLAKYLTLGFLCLTGVLLRLHGKVLLGPVVTNRNVTCTVLLALAVHTLFTVLGMVGEVD